MKQVILVVMTLLICLVLLTSCNNSDNKVVLSDSMPYVTCEKSIPNLISHSDSIVHARIVSDGEVHRIPLKTGISDVDDKLRKLDTKDDLYWELTYFDAEIIDCYLGNIEISSAIRFYQIGGLNDSETKVHKDEELVLFLNDKDELGYTTSMQEHSIFIIKDGKVESNSNIEEFRQWDGKDIDYFIQSVLEVA